MIVYLTGFQYIILPICINCRIYLRLRKDGRPFAVIGDIAIWILIVVEQIFFFVKNIDKVHVIAAVETVQTIVISLLQRPASLVCNAWFPFCALLGGDEHNTICCTYTINRG